MLNNVKRMGEVKDAPMGPPPKMKSKLQVTSAESRIWNIESLRSPTDSQKELQFAISSLSSYQ